MTCKYNIAMHLGLTWKNVPVTLSQEIEAFKYIPLFNREYGMDLKQGMQINTKIFKGISTKISIKLKIKKGTSCR